jgi:hypothetical protein
MPRTFTLAELETRLRSLTDTVNDTHLSQAEMWDFINGGIARTIDKLVESGNGEHLTKKVTFSTVANQSDYVVTTVIPAGDFYRLIGVQVRASNSWLPVRRLVRESSQLLRAPQGVSTVRLTYLPYASKLTTGTDTFDGINGFEDMVLMCAAIDVKRKKEEDTAPFERQLASAEARVTRMAKRDDNEPNRIVERRTGRARWSRFFTGQLSSFVTTYDLIGANLELYQADALFGVP